MILAQLDVLGGDTKAMRAYAEAVSATKLDVSDYSSTLARIKAGGRQTRAGSVGLKILFCSFVI